MEGLTRGEARAAGATDGITVNAVAPSLIETDMMSGQKQARQPHPTRPLRHRGGGGEGRDAAGRQCLHDRTDDRAERRDGVQLMA